MQTIERKLDKAEVLNLYCQLLGISPLDILSRSNIKVEIVNEGQKSKGFWVVDGFVRVVKVDGKFTIEINLPTDLEELGKKGTLAHEVTHLIHMLINKFLFRLETERLELSGELEAIPLSEFNVDFLAIETGLPQTILEKITKLGEALGIPLSVPTAQETLSKFINNEAEIKAYGMSLMRVGQVLVDAGYADQSYSSLIRICVKRFHEWREYINTYKTRKGQLSEKEFDDFWEKEHELRDYPEDKELRKLISELFLSLTDSDALNVLRILVLDGLCEVEAIAHFEKSMEQLDMQSLKLRISAMIETGALSPRKIETIYYDLRPGGYYSIRDNEEWLSVQDPEEKLSRIQNYIAKSESKNSLIYIARTILEEDILEGRTAHVATAICLGSDQFWDFAPGSPLMNNSAYMLEFQRSVQQALESGDFSSISLPNPQAIAQASADSIGQDSRESFETGLKGLTDGARERIFTAIGQTRYFNSFKDFRHQDNELMQTVKRLKDGIDKYYENGGNAASARSTLLRSYEVEHLKQQITQITTSISLLIEPVAYAITKVVTGKVHEFDEPAYLGYGVAFTAKDFSGRAMILKWVDAIEAFLRQDLAGNLPLFLQCETVEEQRKLVGFES